MKKVRIVPLLFIAGVLGALWACKKNGPTMADPYGVGGGGTPGPTPTPIPNGYNIACSGTQFSPDHLTISAGQNVTWTASCSVGHTLYINNGSGGSSCPVHSSTFPFTQVFSTPGTYEFHCSVHSACGTASCSSCTGMAGTITVN